MLSPTLPPIPSTLPSSEEDLLARCQLIAGMTFAHLASMTHLSLPQTAGQHKGWVGQAVELALAADGNNKSQPDFAHLGIELKTIPLKGKNQPAESTYITTVPLLTIHQQTWQTSPCYQKLKRVLWLPLEGDRQIPFAQRRIGSAFLWSPDQNDLAILEKDWWELTTLVTTGCLEEINASLGEYLQIRPKGLNSRSLCYGFDAEGNKILTLPRGFYLRSRFTKKLFA